MEWSPEGPKGEVRLDEVLAYKFRLTSYGYMKMCENGTLLYTKPGEYRWHGAIQRQVFDEAGKEIYHIEEIECITLTPVGVPP